MATEGALSPPRRPQPPPPPHARAHTLTIARTHSHSRRAPPPPHLLLSPAGPLPRPAPCGTGLRAALEPRRRWRLRSQEWRSLRPGPAQSERAAGLQGASQFPQRRRRRHLLLLLLPASFTLPAAAQPFTPARAGQRLPRLPGSGRGRWRGRRPGLGRSRAPGSGPLRRLHMIRKLPYQQGGGGGGSCSQGRHRHSGRAPGTAHPLPQHPPLSAPRSPTALRPATRAKSRRGRGRRPFPVRSRTPGQAGLRGETPTPGLRGQAAPAGKPSPSPDPLALAALFGERSEEGAAGGGGSATPGLRLPLRHLQGGGHGSPHSRPDRQPP